MSSNVASSTLLTRISLLCTIEGAGISNDGRSFEPDYTAKKIVQFRRRPHWRGAYNFIHSIIGLQELTVASDSTLIRHTQSCLDNQNRKHR
jgi:hypothetical protein